MTDTAPEPPAADRDALQAIADIADAALTPADDDETTDADEETPEQ